MVMRCPCCGKEYRDSVVMCDRCAAVLVPVSDVMRLAAGEPLSKPAVRVCREQNPVEELCRRLRSEKITASVPDILTKIVGQFLKWWETPAVEAKLLGDGVEISERQVPKLYSLLKDQCQQLSIKAPRLFIAYRDPLSPSGDFGYNAYTFGTDDRSIIFLSSALVDNFPPDEIGFILAHECAHVRCRHVTYSSIGLYLQRVALGMLPFQLPFVNVVASVLQSPLLAWMRESEYSADILGLFISQDIEAACRGLARLVVGSGGLVDSLNIPEYLRQSRELNSFHGKRVLYLERTHPYTVRRIERLIQEFNRGLNGYVDKRYQSPGRVQNWPGDGDLKVKAIQNCCEVCAYPLSEDGRCPFCG